MSDVVEPWARAAIDVAPLGSRSGEARWAAAQMIRAQQDEIARLRAEIAAARADLALAREREGMTGAQP